MSLILNRRGFLIAGGLTALASTKAFGANERLRVGVIGAGGRMKSVLNSADQSGVPFEIVSVCDVYAPRRAEIKARGNAATATEHVDYHDVLDDKTIDAVFIATPDHWHVRIATAALAAGKDVYLEKPMIHLYSDGPEIINAARTSNRILQVGSQRVSSIVYSKAKELLASGAIGKLNMVTARWDRNSSIGAWNYSIPLDASLETCDWQRFLGSWPWSVWRCFLSDGCSVH